MMFQFDKISVKQISVFCEVLLESSLLQREFLEQKYLRGALNFTETADFLEHMGLIKVRGDRVLPEPIYKAFLERLKKTQRPEQIMREFIIDNLVAKKTRFSGYVEEFLFQFHEDDEEWAFDPSSAQRLKYSGLRNFLIDLGFLYLDSKEGKYLIADNYLSIYLRLKESHQLTPSEFLLIQQKREQIGRAAEIRIIEYERERLSDSPRLAEKIEHIATKDVTAGYDIRSFDENLNNDESPVPRYIEVKAVSLSDYRFNWTRNEIEKARLYRQAYYLYLLPVVTGKTFDLDALRIIRDPYSNVYRNEDEWKRREELMAFSLSKPSDNEDLEGLEKPLE